jgi:cyanophycinase
MPGLLLLNGGDEFRPGNEPQDSELVAATRGPAYVVATAAARQRPDLAVATARDWFAKLGLEIEELPVYNRRDASAKELVARAAGAGLFYLTGGDPGLVARVLSGSAVWKAMLGAWAGGAHLAGSSAGAMVMCERTLVMARWPRHHERRAVPGLDLVPRTAVVPHYERFGPRWTVSELPPEFTLLGIDERTAAVWDGERWRALGEGGVTVGTGAASRRFPSGTECAGIPAPRPEPAPPASRGGRARP